MINFAITAVVLAGSKILEIYNNPAAGIAVERKADNSPLTLADKAAHTLILQQLQAAGLPVLSEEGKITPYDIRRQWESFWLVDPLDGTKEFIKRNGEFTVNIALITRGVPAAGVIYVPVSRTLYVGTQGQGAWKTITATPAITIEDIKRTGQKLPCMPLPETYTIAGSRSHMNPETEAYFARRKAEHGQIQVITKGSSLKICLVAEGAAHEYPRFGPTMEWDTAAGHAIARAAGKNVCKTDASGELTYNKPNLLNPFFVAGPRCQEQ